MPIDLPARSVALVEEARRDAIQLHYVTYDAS